MKKCPQCGEFMAVGSVQCRSCQGYMDKQPRADERYDWGNHAAKLRRGAVEIKCRRCKRIWQISLPDYPEHFEQRLSRLRPPRPTQDRDTDKARPGKETGPESPRAGERRPAYYDQGRS